jgi:hypothetical protein
MTPLRLGTHSVLPVNSMTIEPTCAEPDAPDDGAKTAASFLPAGGRGESCPSSGQPIRNARTTARVTHDIVFISAPPRTGILRQAGAGTGAVQCLEWNRRLAQCCAGDGVHDRGTVEIENQDGDEELV